MWVRVGEVVRVVVLEWLSLSVLDIDRTFTR